MKELIIQRINKVLRSYKSRYFTESIWEPSIIGFADANDRDFRILKNAVDSSHLLPYDVLNTAKTVIAYFIPFTDDIINSNRVSSRSSKEWALAYIETNNLIDYINNKLSKMLNEKGFESSLISPTHNFDENLLISNWSHKHIAYIAGLGKFGLHKMLITEQGCCGRIGSLVTSARIEPTKKITDEFCLFYHNQSCKKCVENCIFDALKIDSFNRKKCYEICLDNAEIFKNYGLADVCGKCACNIPCASKNPVKKN